MLHYILIFGLTMAFLILLFHFMIIKGNIRELRKELRETKDIDYNRQMRIILQDKDVEGLATEINGLLDYQRKLKMDNEKSRRQLEQSISDIAHDLRTPLTVVKGNLQMLENEHLSEKGMEYLDISSRKADNLKEMVDEFFELSVLESDDRPVELCKLDIIGFLSEFIVENETIIRQKGLTPEITFPEKSIFVNANKEMMARVLGNIISNIFKYAEDSFELTVSEYKASDRNMCSIIMGNQVKDSQSIDIEHIFDRTYRADKARSTGSAGLGLYIARLLMTKQGGGITAELSNDRLIFDIKMPVTK